MQYEPEKPGVSNMIQNMKNISKHLLIFIIIYFFFTDFVSRLKKTSIFKRILSKDLINFNFLKDFELGLC